MRNKKVWDLEEFVRAVKPIVGREEFENVKRYIDSLGWGRWRINYHIENYEKEIRKFRKIKIVDTKEDVKKFILQMKKCAEEVICIIQIQQSILDILSQIINQAFLKPSLKEEEASFNKILCKKIERRWRDKELFEKSRELKNSQEFKYISAFSNVVKHRKIIKEHLRIKLYKSGLRFEGFEYKGEEYYKMFFEDIIRSYIPFINDLIVEIGLLINRKLLSE